MKVFCINDEYWGVKGVRKMTKGPKYGDICTVVETDSLGDCIFYVLQEWGKDEVFDAKEFIPLSDISETEMERNYIKEHSVASQNGEVNAIIVQ